MDDKLNLSYSDPYDDIATAFNNYNEYNYHNITFILNEDGEMNKNDGYTFSFPIVKNLNPSNNTRPLRLGDEIKNKIGSLRTDYDLALNAFQRKTGEGGDGDLQQYFYKRSGNDGILLYTYLIWADNECGKSGKSLPLHASVESGINCDSSTFIHSTPRGRKQRKANPSPSSIESHKRSYSETISDNEKLHVANEGIMHLQRYGSNKKIRDFAERALIESSCSVLGIVIPKNILGSELAVDLVECEDENVDTE